MTSQVNCCLLGDCFDLLNDIPNETIDLILTDIPYSVSRENNFKTMKDRTGRTGIEFGEWDKDFDISKLKQLEPKIKQGGSLVIFHSFEQYMQIVETLSGLILKDRLIFRKTNPMPRNRDRRYVSNVELFTWFIKEGKNWIFNRNNPSYEESVMSFPAESGGGFIKYHPTQKPLKLFEKLIKTHTNEGDLILDPFAGSGTTAIASISTNRKYICIEKDESYFNKIQGRISQQTKPLEAFN